MRVTSTITGTAAAVAAFSGLASAFTANAKTNVVTYWGQGPNQGSLQDVCKNPNVDIVNIGFINVFPDQGKAGWPGSNFGNACTADVYTYKGTKTQLYSNCPNIGTDIAICQQVYGKKVLLSIGGGYPTNYFINNDTSAANFANFLWGAFGPVKSEWTSTGGPRPFGDAVVDGFDFDIESELSSAPVVNGKALTNYKTNGYVKMIQTFKNTLFPKDSMKPYYISGAPQCIVPDEHFATVVASAWFDFLFVQYYNTAACSARQAVTSGTFKGYNDWAGVKSFNTDVKLYVGLPGSTAAASDASYYLKPSEVKSLVSKVYSNSRFGGIMVWEATYAANNVICNRNYLTWMKQILNAQADGTTLNTVTSPCPAAPVSKDGTCGGYNGYTCAGSAFGSCCSKYGYCGSSADYCSTANCDSKFGKCGVLSSSSSSKKVSSTSSNKVSTSSKKVSSSSKASSSAKIASVSRAAKFAAGANNSTLLAGTGSASAIIAPFGTGIAAAAGTGGLIGTGATTVVVPETIYGTAPVSGARVTPSAGFPQVAPYANSTNPRFGNAANNANNANGAAASQVIVDTTIFVTRTIYQTQIQTVTGTNAQGSATTDYVTETVRVYTTVTPVVTQISVPSSNSNKANNANGAGAAQVVDTTIFATRTVYQTQVQTVTGTNAQGAFTTKYVTETVQVYTTVSPVVTQISVANKANAGNSNSGSPSGSSESTVADDSGKSSNGDTMPALNNDIRYSAVTQTVYKTSYVTATIRQSVVTYTTSYPISTIINYAPTNTNSMSTTTTTVKTTKTFTETIRVGGASNAPFAFNNATANIFAPSGTAIINAAYIPNAAAASSSPSASIIASSSASPVVIYQTQTIVAVQAEETTALAVAAAGPTAGTASNSRIYGAGSNSTAAFERSALEMEMKAVMKGAASNVHTDIGLCVLALFVGAFFVM
ncbi:glycoside hydrolase [Aureobasidium pullulans]|uniref:chitinase n=1 Tax=Aureobasidium pullulans TaxID=5580 RepID=A0A4T0B8Q5_AURPU|nr:glycoside hydrolase [Aureobasidium pullulans]